MNENDIRALALFFFFAMLDDRKAIDCSIEAMSICQDRKRKNPELKSSVTVIFSSLRVWNKANLKGQRGLPNSSIESGWLIPGDIDLGPWREFQKNATNDELLTLIWSKILNYSDQDISEALGISTGTVRYRLARACRKLGSMTHQVARAPLPIPLKNQQKGRQDVK
jgi:hypothetical protein